MKLNQITKKRYDRKFDEFNDFKPAKVDDGVNDTVKKVIEKELSKLVDFVLLKSSFKDTNNNRVWIETAIGNMQMMGLLIETEAGLLKITDLGLSAYNSQLYHQTAASLYEAKESRRLAKYAIYIALAGIILTVFLQLCRG